MNARTLLLVAAAVSGSACSTNTPIGALYAAGSSGAAPTGAGGMAGVAPAKPAPVLPGQSEYVPLGRQILNDAPYTNPSGTSGDWVGYFENRKLPSGSDAVRLHLGVDAAGHDTVTVTVGMGTLPPPPTDAFEIWPPGDGTPDPTVDVPRPFEGWVYQAHEVTWQGNRLQFSLLDAEPWGAWCGLQTSYSVTDDGLDYYSSCNAGASFKLPDPWDTLPPLSTCLYTDSPGSRCTKYHDSMCRSKFGYCACNGTGCGVDSSFRTSYDVTFYGDHADGSAVDRPYGFGPYTVRLRPAAP